MCVKYKQKSHTNDIAQMEASASHPLSPTNFIYDVAYRHPVPPQRLPQVP